MDSSKEVDSIKYVRALARSWWLIVLAVIAGGAGGWWVYHSATPMYQTGVRLVVTLDDPNLDQISSVSIAASQAQALQQVATTGPAIMAAETKAGVTGVPGITASASGSSPFVTISVTDTNPVEAAKVAAAYIDVLPDAASQLTGSSSTKYTLQTVSPAYVPASPFKPVRSHDLGFGLAAGLILGIVLALVRAAFNRTIRDSDELSAVTGLRTLGSVPRGLAKKDLPAVSHPRSPRSEAYRQLRTTLQSATPKRPLVVAFTSAMPGEGKTTVASNLAVAFRRAGHSVVLIDADLRRPRLTGVFSAAAGPGLTQLLRGTATLSEAVVPETDVQPALIAAGRATPDPSELLESDAMPELLKKLAVEYEFVFIDTPPVLPVADALGLAAIVDGVVLVSRMNVTTAGRVNHAVEALERVHANILGVIANQARRSGQHLYRYTNRYSAAQHASDEGREEPLGGPRTATAEHE